MNLAVLALTCAMFKTTQGGSLSGDVRMANGTPCADTTVTLGLPTRQGTDSNGHTRAMALQFDAAGTLSTTSDAKGRFRIPLTPLHSALAAAGGLNFDLTVQAHGAATWRRALGSDPSLADGLEVVLHPLPVTALLRITCEREDGGPVHGFVVIQRQLQLPGPERIEINDVLPLDPAGRCTFEQPPHLPGNRDPMEPWIQAEFYRLQIHAIGCEPLQLELPPGLHSVRLKTRTGTPCKVVRADGTPARPPITAFWQLGGKEVKLTFLDNTVERLGGNAPIRITTSEGSAQPSADPADPTFRMVRPSDAAPTLAHDLTLQIVDMNGAPVAGAGVWISDQAITAAQAAIVPYAISDNDGQARLQQVPTGQFRVLAAHPIAGRTEANLRFAEDSTPARLRLRQTGRNLDAPVEGLPGRLWLDLATLMQDGATLEVGVLKQDRTLVTERFSSVPARIRIEGLWPGATTLYLRLDERPPLLLGNVLVRPGPGEVLTLREPPRRRLLLYLRGADGQPVLRPRMSLGEGGAVRLASGSARLFRLVSSGQPGLFHAEIHAVGAFRFRIHGDADDTAELPFPPTSEGDVIDLRLVPAER